MERIHIRPYAKQDYPDLRQLYEESGWFDPETDAEDRLGVKIERDSNSVLVAFSDDQAVGTVSLIEDGRIALFFRLVSKEGEKASTIRAQLLEEGEKILKQRGYKEAHIIAPENDRVRQDEYEQYGFKKGKPYRWMWKKIE